MSYNLIIAVMLYWLTGTTVWWQYFSRCVAVKVLGLCIVASRPLLLALFPMLAPAFLPTRHSRKSTQVQL